MALSFFFYEFECPSVFSRLSFKRHTTKYVIVAVKLRYNCRFYLFIFMNFLEKYLQNIYHLLAIAHSLYSYHVLLPIVINCISISVRFIGLTHNMILMFFVRCIVSAKVL